MGTIPNTLSTTQMSSILAPQGPTTTNNASGNGAPSSLFQKSDQSQLSPFALIVTTLQQLQQSNPSQYQQLTQQIATNLQAAAKTAQADGNTAAAGQLNQLASDFTSASQSGQLPNLQDLAKAGGGHHHHHAAATGAAESQGFSQALAAFQGNSLQNASLDPQATILQTIENASNGSSTSA